MNVNGRLKAASPFIRWCIEHRPKGVPYMNKQIFGREYRPQPSVLSKLCYAALGIVLPFSVIMAPEPGEGLRQKPTLKFESLTTGDPDPGIGSH